MLQWISGQASQDRVFLFASDQYSTRASNLSRYPRSRHLALPQIKKKKGKEGKITVYVEFRGETCSSKSLSGRVDLERY